MALTELVFLHWIIKAVAVRMVGSDAFNIISPTRLELAVYRVCIYISLMTSGEFVRFYSLSVPQGCQEHQQELCVLHILDNVFG